MFVAAFSLLSAAALLGVILLAPSLPVRGRLRRSLLAATHGIVGTAAIVVTTWGLRTGPKVSSIIWSGYTLVAVGFCLGLTVFALSTLRQKVPALIVPLHVLFAGMGYLVLAGLVLAS